jgi:hypothetical protein
MFDKLAFREALKSWSIGMAIATPTIALLQGGLLLFGKMASVAAFPLRISYREITLTLFFL